MAILNSVAVSTPSGVPIAADNLVITSIHFPSATLNIDPDTGEWDGTVTRYITYDLSTYLSVGALQALEPFIEGGTKEYGTSWTKVMTDQEYLDILANGTLAEVWLKDHLDVVVPGNAASIIDPYVPI